MIYTSDDCRKRKPQCKERLATRLALARQGKALNHSVSQIRDAVATFRDFGAQEVALRMMTFIPQAGLHLDQGESALAVCKKARKLLEELS